MDHKTPLFQNLEPFWKGNTNNIWLATTLCLHRNIDKFVFPQRLETNKKDVLSDLLFSTITETNTLNQPTKLSYNSMQAMEKEYLYEHFLEFKPAKDSLLGESFIFDATGHFLIKINVQDHIEIQGIETKGNLEPTFEKIQELERAIEKQIPFAFSNKFGYLTEDPTICGTGLVVKAFLHVPASAETNELSSFLTNSQNEGISITGIQGSSDEIIGNMIVVSNQWTIGTTEESILSLVRTTALAIASFEKEMRSKVHTMPVRDETLFDKMSRIVGTLKFCYSIDTSETLRALSVTKLGIELGWIQGITIEKLNEQFFALRRAHIASILRWNTSQEAINHERARLLRSLFAPVELHTN